MARTIVAPQWLKSTHVTGLDQLGVQVISIALYTDLLPGITNVTDRIRYYSFYPWLLHRYASDVKIVDENTWQEHLRRAEFLLALVGRLHHREEREGGEALVGADQANKALAEIQAKPTKAWRLSQWTAVRSAGQPGSYFKNKNGGFGQYYRGQLASLGLINFSDDSKNILAVEREIVVPLTNSRGDLLTKPLVAVIDLITKDGSGLSIVDVKTSSKRYGGNGSDRALQARCYLHAVGEYYGQAASMTYTVLVKTKTPTIQDVGVDPVTSDSGRLGDLIETVDRAVQNEVFYPVESAMNCATCPFFQPCRAWQSSSKPTDVFAGTRHAMEKQASAMPLNSRFRQRNLPGPVVNIN